MAKVPVRGLGDAGIIKDVEPFDLPPNAWSSGENIRFDDGQVKRGSVFRDVTDKALLSTTKEPVFTAGLLPEQGHDEVLVVYKDLTLFSWKNDVLTDVTPTVGFTPADATSAVTVSTLSEVHYVNRPSHVPLAKRPSDSTFVVLPNWDSTWRCKALRPYKDMLIAMNISKGATEYPSLVKWSHYALAGQVPSSWDHTDATVAAGENPLTDATTGIVDGGALHDSFVIYTKTETFVADFIGEPFLFSWRKLFSDAGAIGPNCFVEVNGKHYVFGTDDIWMHDGVSKISIAERKVRKYINRIKNNAKADKFFVTYNAKFNLVMFCFVDSREERKFKGTDYCNYAAAYNVATGAWTFFDLPNVSAGDIANVDTSETWDTVNMTWDTAGGSWSDQSDTIVRHLVFSSVKSTANGITKNRILAMDPPTLGQVAKPLVAECTAPAKVERIGIDLDNIGLDLEVRKAQTRVFPQITTSDTSKLPTMSIGIHEYSGSTVKWGSATSFNPTKHYKIDSRSFGRYLAFKVEFPEADSTLSGYDVEIVQISKR